MHDTLALRPWVLWLVYGVTFVLVAGAIALIVNALRRPDVDFGRLGRWPWLVLQGLFLAMICFALVASVLEFGSVLSPAYPAVLGTVVLLAAVQQVAYLLRVVYPSPRRRGADEREHGG